MDSLPMPVFDRMPVGHYFWDGCEFSQAACARTCCPHYCPAGFPLTASDQISFNKFLAQTAHLLGLAAGLKKDIGQASDLVTGLLISRDELCISYCEVDRIPFSPCLALTSASPIICLSYHYCHLLDDLIVAV
jgi:hypothetical protein